MRQLVWLWLPVGIWCMVIFWLSSIPGLAIATGAADFWTRKPAHVAEYTVLFLLIYRALSNNQWYPKTEWVWKSAALMLIYAASDEIHQSFVPRRTAHITDWLIDSLAILVAVGLLYWWQWFDRATKAPKSEPTKDQP